MKNVVIFDLDNTLACLKHRLHLLPKPDLHLTSSWKEFNKACINDAPIWDTIDVLNAMVAAGKAVIIMTGRSDDAFEETRYWLDQVGVLDKVSLIMRNKNDCRKDTVIKEEWLRSIGLHNILCCFDDYPSVISHFRSLGLTVYDVVDHGDISERSDLQSHGAEK